MRKKIDCALLFALEEEFNILKDNQEVQLKEDYFHFTFTDKNGQLCEGVAGFVGEPGSQPAYKYLAKFNEKFEPFVQVVIGLSGQISDDVSVGDIVVASSVDKYDYNSKHKDGGMLFSSRTINLTFNNQYLLRLKANFPSQFKNWQSTAVTRLKNLLKEEQLGVLCEHNFIRKELHSDYHYGNIATGESLIDDHEFKRILASRDRKLLCVDMESYGFADYNQENDGNLIIIRVISDTADGRKKLLDNFESLNLLRKWGLQNAYSLFRSIVVKNLEFPSSKPGALTPFSSHKVGSLDNDFIKIGPTLYDKYSTLFNHLMLKVNEQTDNSNIYENLKKCISDGEEGPVVVQGWPGTGKTTLLYTFHKFLNGQSLPCYYLDLHQYKNDLGVNPAARFEDDMTFLKKQNLCKYLIIDGLDQFERFFQYQEIKIEHHWSELYKKYECIILGITTQDYENDEDETKHFYLPNPKLKIELSNFSFDEQNFELLLQNLLYIHNIQSSVKTEEIRTFLKKIGLKELDWHTANMIIKKKATGHYEDVNSIGKFFLTYSRECFATHNIKSPIKTASEMTFRKFINNAVLDQADYKSPIWKFIQMSNTIKQFLIAEYLIFTYSNLEENFKKSSEDLNHIYSYKINSFFKDNINRNNVQEKVYNSVTRCYQQFSLFQKPNACYILGRLESLRLKADARIFLEKQLDYELRDYESKKYLIDEGSFRQHLLLIRTMFISLVYQNDMRASERYLDFLLSDQEWDDLNRGFHLEYYSDKPYDPMRLGLHNDELSINFTRTYARLAKRIYDVIQNPEPAYYLMMDIELQTITSLAINRHLVNKLDPQLRDGIQSMLLEIKKNQVQLIKNIKLKPFIDFALYVLVKDTMTPGDIVREVHGIKTIKRSGWNFKGKKDGISLERHVSNVESVSDHIFGTMIIAMLLLPAELKNEPTYNKADVLDTLLIHDLAEAYTGDIVSFKKNEANRNEEYEKMGIIFSSQIVKGFGNFKRYKELWENYTNQSTTTAKVAKEIDKIEQLLQLTIYAENKENNIPDYVTWRAELMKLIDTNVGKSVLHILLPAKNEK